MGISAYWPDENFRTAASSGSEIAVAKACGACSGRLASIAARLRATHPRSVPGDAVRGQGVQCALRFAHFAKFGQNHCAA